MEALLISDGIMPWVVAAGRGWAGQARPSERFCQSRVKELQNILQMVTMKKII